MKWLAAMIMATQIASAAVGVTASAQTAPALTPQQKQELSTYNFKGAEAALEAQANQPAPKPSPLTPIPPLKVPPIVSRNVLFKTHRLSLPPLALRRTKARRFR